MKIWKKLSLLLSLSFMFSTLTACDALFGGGESASESEQISQSEEGTSEENSEQEEETPKTTETYELAVSAQVAATDRGVDMKVEVDTSNLDMDEETATVMGVLQEVYYVDDFLYAQDPDSGIWVKMPSSMAYMMGENAAMWTDMLLTASDVVKTIKETSAANATITMDYADDMNNFLDYMSTVTDQTPLVDVLDAVLAIDGYSYQMLIDDVLGLNLGAYTVSEVYATVQDLVVANTEYATLPEFKDALFADEDFYAMLVDALGEEAALTAKEYDIAAAEVRYGNWTMDQVLCEISDDEIQTVEILVRGISTALGEVTLADVFGADAGVTEIALLCSMIEVSEYKIVTDIKASRGKLAGASIAFDFAVEINIGTEILEYVIGMDMEVEFVDEVVAPTGAMTMCNECGQPTTDFYNNEVYLCEDCKANMDARYGEYSFVYYSSSTGSSRTSDPDNYPADRVVEANHMSLVVNEDGTAVLTAPWGTFPAVWYENGYAVVAETHGTAYISFQYEGDNVILTMDFYGGEELGESYYEYYVFKK